jgi:hypothetical protein
MAYQTIVRVNSAGLSMISPHRALARSTHSQFILLADCITKARKGNAVEFLPNSAMCDAADTVQTLQFFGLQLHVAGAARLSSADLMAGRRRWTINGRRLRPHGCDETTQALLLYLTRFLHANRHPSRIKCGTGFRWKTLWPL